MKNIIVFFCLAFSVTVQAQKEKTLAYINAYKELAITEMMRTGVPAAIKLAQGILESQSGESDLAKHSNNHFGIKCKTEWTGEKTYHDDDARGECFRVYTNPAESFKDHSDFLKTRAHYAFLFKIDPTDSEAWAKGLKKAGYATLPTYPQRLLKVIKDYQLDEYSLVAIARLKNGETPDQITTVAVSKPFVPAPVIQEVSLKTKFPAAVMPDPVTTTKNSQYPDGIFTINHAKVIYANAGVSLLALADQHALSLSKLLDYNELPEMDILDTNRLLFLEKKMKKGAADLHLVTTDETLHDICQKEGIRMESLLEYNKLKKGASLSAGEKLYLRPATPATGKLTAKSR